MSISPVDTTNSPCAKLHTLSINTVSFSSGFWANRQSINREISLYHAYDQLTCAGNFNNLHIASGQSKDKFRGLMFADSDVYKWLEAVAYALTTKPDPRLQKMADHTIDLIETAQTNDGYVNSYWQTIGSDRRWEDLELGHELYCAGHLIQAGIAYHFATGDPKLLEVSRRFADHIIHVFRSNKKTGIPGHPEIETALIELYRYTSEHDYLDMANHLINQRGNGLLKPNILPSYLSQFGSEYFQDHVPVRESVSLTGHAVRQLYLNCGVTDLYLETGERALYDALIHQWIDMAKHHLFITGGVGSQPIGETFGEPYVLPNNRCYCETCAQIASIMWNWRMLLATGEAQYADLIETTLYNGFLSGVSLDGRKFFYVNPLQSTNTKDYNPFNNENLGRTRSERQQWFDCACCPPNVMRLIASFGHYIATRDANGLQIHQYAQASLNFETNREQKVLLRMETNYPWDGLVKIIVDETGINTWTLSLRIPKWAENASIRINDIPSNMAITPGTYLSIQRTWQKEDSIELDLSIVPTLMKGHPRIEYIRGCVALQRGPLIYCFEQIDQETSTDLRDIKIDPFTQIRDTWQRNLLGGIMTMEIDGYMTNNSNWHDQLYHRMSHNENLTQRRVKLIAIPYYAWANRGPETMRVWIPLAHVEH